MDAQPEKEQKAHVASTGMDAIVLDVDDAELETAGYKREMPRQFTTLSLMALSFDLMGTWIGEYPGHTHYPFIYIDTTVMIADMSP